MPKLTEHMKQLIQEQPVVYVATSDDQGRPNVSPKGALKILGDDRLLGVVTGGFGACVERMLQLGQSGNRL